MGYKRLFLFVEGSDDERFCERIIRNFFKDAYDYIQIWRYANVPNKDKKTKSFLKSIKSMNADYFFFKDINDSPCITAKKDKITNDYGKTIDENRIIIVIKEIESWYLAGLNDKSCTELGIKTFNNTNDITKEQFDNIKPHKHDSHIDFMVEVLKRFSIETARRKSKSFDYLLTKIESL